jgi:hypothetical protein
MVRPIQTGRRSGGGVKKIRLDSGAVYPSAMLLPVIIALELGASVSASAAPAVPLPADWAARVAGSNYLVRSHCRFRNRATESVSESGVKWMSRT